MTQPNGPYEWLPALRDVLGTEVKYPDSNAISRGPWIVLDVSYGVQWEDNEPWTMDWDGADHPWDHWMPKQQPGWNGITLYRRINESSKAVGSGGAHHIFQLVRGYVWFFDGEGNDEAGSPSDVATQMINLSEKTIADLGANPVLDAKTLTRASDLLFNVSWWLMNQGRPQLQSLGNEIDEPGSDFDGSAADAFSWALREMAFGMLSLKENITDPIDWTQRLDQNASDVDTFKEAMRAAWSAYKAYQYYDPNQLVWGILRSMEQQVDNNKSELDVGSDRNAANLQEWNFSFPEQGLPGPYNLMQNSGWQQLDRDMISSYKPHLDKLNQDSLAATQKLIDSFNVTYQALQRPVLPLPHLPPPSTGDGSDGSGGSDDDSKIDLSDLFKDGGGGGGGGEGGGGDIDLSDLFKDGGGGGGGNGGGEGGGSGLPDDVFTNSGGGGGGSGLPNEFSSGGGSNLPNLSTSGGGGSGLPNEFSTSGGSGLPNEFSSDGGSGLPNVFSSDGGSGLPNEFSSGGGSGLPEEFTTSGGGSGGGLPVFTSSGGTSGLPRLRDPSGTGTTSGAGGDGSDDDRGGATPPDFSGSEFLTTGPGADGTVGGEWTDRGGTGLDEQGTALVPGTTDGYSAVGRDGGFTLGPLGTPPPGYTAPAGLDVPDFSGSGGQVALSGPGAEQLVTGGGFNGGGSNGGGFTSDGLGAAAPGATGPAGTPGATNPGGMPGMPFMPPMGGMGGMGGGRDNERERERSTWLTEDSDVWGTDPECAPAVVGRDDLPEPGSAEQPIRRTAPPRRTGDTDTGGRQRAR